IGLILVIVGLTGSILVFQKEIDSVLVKQKFEQVIPQAQTVSLEEVADNVTQAYANQPDWKLAQFVLYYDRDIYRVRLSNSEDQQLEVFVNAYTGKILGDRLRNQGFFGRVYELHYSLLAGSTGFVIVGIAALLMCILAITGLLLWSGWRNLISGFKIKLNASSKRKNYDIHKVVGIIALVFLAFTGFTGFIWNFYEQTEPAIYALTLTSKPEIKSTVIGKSPLAINEIIQQAIATIPEATPTFIDVPTKPDAVFTVYLKQPQDAQYFANRVEIDRYSGEVLYVVNSQNAKLGDRLLNAFIPMHYGTFGGLPTRILYVFVGFSPMILFVTGLIMYRLRYRPQRAKEANRELIGRL
ncbi:MAG: PepSY-associated TM helix domain-containing protein, partial [Waterburya sp.]